MNYGERQRLIHAVMSQRGISYWDAASWLGRRGAAKRIERERAEAEQREREREQIRRWRSACGEEAEE
jgi:hypothetical protein